MSERRRRGLGRGLGALINSDSRELEEQGHVAEETSAAAPAEQAASSGQPDSPEGSGEQSEVVSEAAFSETANPGLASTSGQPDVDTTAPASVTGEDAPPESSDQDESLATAVPRETSPARSRRSSEGGEAEDPGGGEETTSTEDTSPTASDPRPIDVFFSAKSHLGTHRISRRPGPSSGRTTARRPASNGRVEMPEIRGARRSPSAKSAVSPVSEAPETVSKSYEDHDSYAVSREAAVSRSTPRHDTAPSSDGEVPSDPSAWTASIVASGEVEGAEFRAVPVKSISPNPRQPRTEFDEDHMAELVHSVREIGVLQPVVVRPVEEGTYELVMGERRWRASREAGLETIPAIIRSTKDDELLRDALLENIHRSQLNPLEEAAAYRQLLDDFSCTQDDLSHRIGRSRPQISNTLRLLRLPPKVQRRVAAGVLSSGHARALLSLETEDSMDELAQRIVAEGLSVRATEEAVTLAKQGDGKVSRGTADRLPSTARYQQLDEYADALTDRLDTQVKITLGAKKGRIAIDFGSIEDLHRLMEMMGPRSA